MIFGSGDIWVILRRNVIGYIFIVRKLIMINLFTKQMLPDMMLLDEQ
jgi:hypothetical protein